MHLQGHLRSHHWCRWPRRRPRHQLDQRRDRGRAAEGGGVGPLLRVQEEGDGGVPAVVSTASIHPGRSHFSTPRAASWPSSSSPSSSRSLSTSASTWWSQRRRFPVASAAVELCEAAAGGGDSVRVIETPQPNSSVSPDFAQLTTSLVVYELESRVIL